MDVLYITYNRLPDGDSGSIRDLLFCTMLAESGIRTFAIGMGSTRYKEIHSYNDISYASIRVEAKTRMQKLLTYTGYKERLADFLENNNHKFDYIIFDDIPISAFFYLRKLASARGVQLIYNCVEWYSPEQFKLGIFSSSYLLKSYLNSKLIDHKVKVVSISNYLHEYYFNKRIRSIRIPFVLDVSKLKFEKKSVNHKMTMIYAGIPGRKDFLKELIDGFALLNTSDLSRFELRIIGVTKEELLATCKVNDSSLEKVKKSVSIMGKVKRSEVLLNLAEADFTILLRNRHSRYAKAGFPSKVVESLATATPVMLNISSDLGMYIKDMKNGIIVEDCSSVSFYNALLKALKLSETELLNMKMEARKTAELHFDYRIYKDAFTSFITSGTNEQCL